ncbi:helix-turn-helix domain-containing protein [Corynebacterium amycolatum]|uniref:helix-turn-helix domain-containing protein n=1 Tax=Corynebacterium amycolatum TaxID=43765 RepID=UPI001E5B8D4A|nr:helix-turn-helix domain-containing protein [Corynebacterium amycolatum]
MEKNTGRHRGDVELWLRQRQEGMAYADIAERSGMHVSHVRRTVQRMMAERGLEDTEAVAVQEHRNRVAGQAARAAAARERALEWRELRDRGLSSAEVAERYGVTPSAADLDFQIL